MPRIIDLFAGLGGIRLGFQEAMDVLGLETEKDLKILEEQCFLKLKGFSKGRSNHDILPWDFF